MKFASPVDCMREVVQVGGCGSRVGATKSQILPDQGTDTTQPPTLPFISNTIYIPFLGVKAQRDALLQ